MRLSAFNRSWHVVSASVDGVPKSWRMRHHMAGIDPVQDLEDLFAHVHDRLLHAAEAGTPFAPVALDVQASAASGCDAASAAWRVVVTGFECPTVRGTLDAILLWHETDRGAEWLGRYPSVQQEAIGLRTIRAACDGMSAPLHSTE
tara:strand:+ start:13296 stop:13733 length:438 start_codon:yes stop_codon:yes gene_type:complete